MKITQFSFLVISLFIFSCQKKEGPPLSNSPVQNSNLINGGFTISQRIDINAQTQLGDTVIEGGFLFFHPAYDLNSGTGAPSYDVGDVRINSIQLRKSFMQPGSPIYEDSTSNIKRFPLNFSVSGNGNYSSDVFTITNNWTPSFSNFSQIPTTISKSAGCTFTLTNLTNNSFGTEVYLGNILCSTNGNVISFTPAQLTSVPVSSNALMRITLKGGDTYQTINGKNYWIQGELRYFYSNLTIVL
ncbi:MAG: hypothetical protein V4580_03920 [Bacteroidota bacterium]